MIAPLQRILAITHKEFLQLGRDRLTFGADLAQTAGSRAVVADALASQVLGSLVRADSAEELEQMLQRGDIVVGIFIPADFERRRQDPERRAAQLLVDGSDPTLVGVANQLRNMPSGLRPGNTVPATGVFEVRNFYNPERRSAVNIVPGLIGVILNLTMVLFTAIAIVRERERGNLELLITTPIRTPELMVGKIAPYILIGLIQVSIILLVGATLFNVPVRGSFLDLYLAALVFIAATLGLGLLISTLTHTQFQAMQLTIFTFLPSILLSGFMFPFDGMPALAQAIAQVLPLTHFIVLVRGIVLKGASLSQLSHALLPLLAFFLATMSLAVIRFRKRLD